MTSGFALSPAIIAAVLPPSSQDRLSAATSSCSSISVPISPSPTTSHGRSKRAFSSIISPRRKNPRSTLLRCCDTSEEERRAKEKIGARVRVTAPLKVYHVVRVPEVEMMGTEGLVEDYVVLWRGKRISANLPFKVEFVREVEGRGPVKFFAHLKEDEFELI